MHPYVVFDVFTDTPLEGNPLAVFTDAEAIPEAILQRLARELNLSETVFVYPGGDTADARIRIFTPGLELPFAGHPVLGAAFVVGERDGLSAVRLETGRGTISIELVRDAERIVSGEMTQPIPTWEPVDEPEAVLDAVLLPTSGLPIEVYDNGPRFVLVEAPDAATLSALEPDMAALEDLGETGVSCFALTGPATAKVRMFAPGSGVAEDPATGSAAGPLAVHLARHGRTAFGEPITITQGVEIGRPSTLIATAYGSSDELERVTVGGCAVLVARGEYRISTQG
ncbi:MAG: PhzF family phenazine biosynthesis protein [Solirubrobacteraceae bacterium]